MAKYDAEDMLDDVLNIMTNGGALNAQIAAIEAEKTAKGKALDPVLKPIDAASYHLQTWTDKILNTSPAIFYGIEDVSNVNGGQANAKTYKIFVEVILVDDGQSNDSSKRIQRYSRALEELFSGAFAPALASAKIAIDSVRPISFKLDLDSNDEVKVGGISLTISLV